ncbi:MAG TPA: carboxypeptidase-like regulatory domain-containing protein [Vicinamibacterales bacterium]|nr:carboxypeptidase-like regulatory domain-containing protein [Vicinamibacterales bacterium]
MIELCPGNAWHRYGALVAALWICGGAAALAAPQTGGVTVAGTVTVPSFLRDQRPEPDVEVALVSATGERRAVATDSAGRFSFPQVPPGPYTLRIDLPQFVAFRQEITVGSTPPPGIAIQLQFKTEQNTRDFIPVRDRWRIDFPAWQRYPPEQPGEYPYVRGRGLDPYDQNVLKGDLPIAGQNLFLVLTATSETPVEFRTLPTPSGVSAERPGSEEFFGGYEQLAVLPSGIFSVELFRGDTAFRPKDWALKITPVLNVNYVNTRERNVLNISPREGNTRRRQHLGLQEAFGELKLFDVGANYDFVSVRAGIQAFTSDFRGFLFRDNNLGVRLFGSWGRSRNQWNLAFFDQLEKETNSELNLLERREQRVVVANYYRQDFLTRGYTFSLSAHANVDGGEEFFFDENGFLVRPTPIGLIQPHKVKAYYAGIAGDGHWGRLNLTHQFYQAFGEDEFNGIAAQKTDINAQFAAVELSIDKDWLRPRASFVWSSGDSQPEDDEARGFDAILDSPNIAGGQFSFWNRQGIRLAQTGAGIVGRLSILPALRSSKTEGQASFVNPGLFLYNLGLDAELTPKLRTTFNVSLLRFQTTEPLKTVLFQDSISPSIGLDYSVGAQYRPWLNDNVIVTSGISVFSPSSGFKALLTQPVLYSPFVMLTVTY